MFRNSLNGRLSLQILTKWIILNGEEANLDLNSLAIFNSNNYSFSYFIDFLL